MTSFIKSSCYPYQHKQSLTGPASSNQMECGMEAGHRLADQWHEVKVELLWGGVGSREKEPIIFLACGVIVMAATSKFI